MLSKKGNIAGTQDMATTPLWKRLSLLAPLTQIVRGRMTYIAMPRVLTISVQQKHLLAMTFN